MRPGWGAIGLSALMMTAAPLAYGQTSITTDGSTGPVVTRTGAANTIGSDLGRLSGTNLFHSYSNFQLQGGNSATWQSTGADSTGAPVTPGNITNVINRVTAGSGSLIDGPINSNYPTADFFFVDPQGVAFGANAAVNVPAGFFVSTAQQMNFTNGDTVAMNSPTSTFSVATPESFGFLGGVVGDLNFNGANLFMGGDDHIVFAAGNITLTDKNIGLGGYQSVSVAATGTSAAQVPLDGSEITTDLTGNVTLTNSNINLATSPGTTFQQVVRLSAGSFTVNNSDGTPRSFGANTVEAARAGNVHVKVFGSMDLVGPNFILSSNSLSSGDAGDIVIHAGSMTLANGVTVGSTAIATGASAGNISVNSRTISVVDGATINASVFTAGATGNAGDIVLNSDALSLSDGGNIKSNNSGSGNAGNIEVTTDSIRLESGGAVDASSFGSGLAGTLNVFAHEVTVDGAPSRIASAAFGSGDGGNINIISNSIDILNGGRVESSALFGSGNAGDILITSDGLIALDGANLDPTTALTGILAGVFAGGTGSSGSVTIVGNDLTIRDSAFIGTNTNTPGAADAGPITISLISNLTLQQSAPSTVPAGIYSISNGVGDGGDITATATQIQLDGGIILGSASRPQASARAGSVNITSRGNFVVDNGGLVGTLASDPDLNPAASDSSAGPLFVSADRLTVRGDGEFIPTVGPQAGSPVTLTSSISSEAIGVDGGSGMLIIEANHVALSDGGKILATTGGDGDGGSLIIRGRDEASAQSVSVSGNAPMLPSLTGFSIFDVGVSAISSDTTREGRAGSVTIATEQLNVTGSAVVTSASSGKLATGNLASTAFAAEDTLPRSGNAGNVTINAGAVNVSDGAIISSRTETLGRGGNVIINAPNIQLTTGGQIDASSEGVGPAADAGLVDIDTTSLSLNASTISTRAGGTQGADAGTINISTTDLFVQNGSTISASSTSGGGGNINIMFNGSTFVLEDSTIIASVAEGAGGGGNITIDNPSVFIVNNGRIIANTLDGLGGTITIDAGVILQGDGDFIVESTSGTGAVQVSSTNSAIGIEGDVEKDEQDVLAKACSDGGNGESSSFTSQVGLDGSRNANVGAAGTNHGCAL